MAAEVNLDFDRVGALASVVQASLLAYLFLLCETTTSVHHPFEHLLLRRLGKSFQHPLRRRAGSAPLAGTAAGSAGSADSLTSCGTAATTPKAPRGSLPVPQSQICPFGKRIILPLLALLLLRAAAWRCGSDPRSLLLRRRLWTAIFGFALTLALVMNMNAFVYLLPAVLIEVLVVHAPKKT